VPAKPALHDASPYPSRTQHRLETRERIFAAAVEEFRRVGVAAAQIEGIVRAAGVARGTFYLHFPTKDDVLAELARRRQESVAERLRLHFDDGLIAFLRRTVDLMLAEVADETPDLGRELLTVVLRHANQIETGALSITQLLAERLDGGRDRGEVRADLEASELAALFLSGIFGLLLFKDDPSNAVSASTLYRAVDVFVRGVAL